MRRDHRLRRTAIFTAALAALTLPAGGPAHAATPTTHRITLAASLAANYDSNILEYSKAQITVFEAGTRPDRYSLQSTDDVVWNPSLALGWEMAGAGGRRHALRLKADGDFHQKNGTADFRSASIGWRESWSRERRLSASWYTLPEFYLRQLIDEDYVPPFPGLSRERRASFSLDIGSLDWTQRVGRSNALAFGTQIERRRYNPEFRERDSNTWQGEAAFGWTRLPRHGRLELRGLYRVSNAKGSDGDEVAGLAPDDADVSYHGAGGGAHGEMEMARGAYGSFSADADWLAAARDFDSNRPADRYHFGRRDLLNTLELGTSLRLKRHWRARAFWQFNRNIAKLGAAAPTTTDAGEYTRSQVGVRCDWTGTLWRVRSAAESDE